MLQVAKDWKGWDRLRHPPSHEAADERTRWGIPESQVRQLLFQGDELMLETLANLLDAPAARASFRYTPTCDYSAAPLMWNILIVSCAAQHRFRLAAYPHVPNTNPPNCEDCSSLDIYIYIYIFYVWVVRRGDVPPFTDDVCCWIVDAMFSVS